jgi:hypothetical protein
MSGRRRTAVIAVTIAAAIVTSAAPTGIATPSRPLPTKDSFYRYAGPKPLGKVHPGTVLKRRQITITLGNQNPTPVTAEQLLYRTRDEQRKPTVTVTTVLQPSTPLPGPDIVGYLSFYDGFGPECDPSYTLAGGYAGTDSNEEEAEEEELLISHYLSAGLVVTVPDFEGEKLHWGASQESGYGTLDALRATESYLHVPRSTKVGLSGYSGGAIAADWASELAPHYAPHLNLVGVAEGGIPVDWVHNLRYVDGSSGYSGTIPGVLMAIGRGFPFALHRHLSTRGRTIINAVRRNCIGSFLGAYPGLTMRQMLKPRYRNIYRIRHVALALNRLIMGSAPGHPKVPLFMGVGDSDGTGDGVMVVKDVEALAHEYCRQGVTVQYSTYEGAPHEAAGAFFEPATSEFLLDRFAGAPIAGNCASIGKGNSLAPLPVPKRRHRHSR